MPIQTVYARETLPDSWTKSVFLAGPTPRKGGPLSWRPEALRVLEAQGYDGVVFVPEDRDINGCALNPEDYEAQILWEHEALRRADAIVFWVPRDLSIDLTLLSTPSGARTIDVKDMLKFPAFTTNIEWGEWWDTGKVALGYPPNAPKMGYFRTKAKWKRIPVASTLEETLSAALEIIGEGAFREGGETSIPIGIWRTPTFVRWHAAQKAAGNVLLDARVLWTYRTGRQGERLFFWAIDTDMRVGAEGRVFKDGVVVGRPDISVTILLGPDRAFQTEVVLVKEFRPAATTSDGYVHEGAGGSSWDELTPIELAAAEAIEETGVALTTSRLRDLGERQLLPTLCAHRAHVYVGRLTSAEMDALRRRKDRPLGNLRDGERTWVEFHTFRGLFDGTGEGSLDVDWSTLGMIFLGFYRHM